MRITAVTLAAVLGLLLPGIAHSKEAAKAKAAKAKEKPKAGACIHFSQTGDQEKRTITFHIDNDCKQDVQCTIAWEVKCVKQDSSTETKHDESNLVQSGMGSSYEASAAVCAEEDGYEISAPRWSCKTPSNDTASNK